MVILVLFLMLQGQCEYVEFELDSTMKLGWEISGPDLHFTFTCPYGWCGIGFGNSMLKTDILIVECFEGGPAQVYDMWSERAGLPQRDEELLANNDASILSKVDIAGGFKVTFSRPAQTADPNDFPIEIGEEFEFAWAYLGGSFLAKHSEKNIGTLKIGYTENESEFKTVFDDTAFRVYGIIMTILWGVMAPIGAVIGRYFKWWKWWYSAHSIIYGLVVVLTVLSANLVILAVENVYTELSPKTVYHSRMGFTVASLVVGQGLLGLMVRYFQRYLTHISIITHLRLLHRTLGWSMLAIGLANVYLGWLVHRPHVLLYIVPYLSLVVAVILVFEFRHQVSFMWPALNLTGYKWKEMTHLEALELVKGGHELGFYDDLVLDLNAFKFTHPGGKFQISQSVGEDVGKFLIGTNSLGSPYAPYAHSKQAFDMILHLAIGRIPIPEHFFAPNIVNYDYLEYVLTGKELIAEKTWVLTLSHPVHKLNTRLLHPSWIGKHVKVLSTIDHEPVTRYYSLFFCDLVGWKAEMGVASEQLGTLEREEGSVQIIYKAHQTGTMTKHFSAMDLGEVLKVALPYGPGLSVRALRGHYLALTAGTGVVPLIDLMYYMWVNKEHLEFSLTLWTRCRTMKEYFIDDVMDCLANTIPEHFTVIYCNSDSGVSSQESISLLKTENPVKIWVCGPSSFNKATLYYLLAEPAYPRHDIVLF